MNDAERLLDLMLSADYNLQELNRLSSEYLGVDGSSIMLDGDLARRTKDLVSWADRHNMLDNLLEGVLLEGVHKRAIREWILGANTLEQPANVLDDPRLIKHLTEVVRKEVAAGEDRLMQRMKDLVRHEVETSEERLKASLAATLSATPTHRIQNGYRATFFGAFVLMFAPVLFYYSDVRQHLGVTWYWSYIVAALFWLLAGMLWYYVFFVRVET